MKNFSEQAVKFKALSDPSRLKILDTLKNGEMCACKILEKFHFTQPTLSHHMGVLCKAGITVCRKEGKWCNYSINPTRLKDIIGYLGYFCGEPVK